MTVDVAHTGRSSQATLDGPPRVPAERLATLDAVRGVAAAAVLVSHAHTALPDALKDAIGLAEGPARILVLGRPAVILFFVLSGFVLSLSLANAPGTSYGSFVSRRIFRIYVPFAVAILLSATLFLMVGPEHVPGLSTWFNRDLWADQPTPEVVAAHLLMIGRPQDATLNSPMWSLVIEMRISLLFPLLFAVLWARPALAIAGTLFGLGLTEALAWRSFGPEPYFALSLKHAIYLTIYFAPFFVLGIALAQHRARLTAVASRSPAWVRGIGWLIALATLSVVWDTVNAIGAALVLILALASPSVRAVLDSPPLQWLGRVSYSLYLTHVIVLTAVVHGTRGLVADPVLSVLASVPLSLVVAHVFFVAVEQPAMRMGRQLTSTQAARTRSSGKAR